MTPLRSRQALFVAAFTILFTLAPALAQQKLLTLDDIYASSLAQRIDFSGSPPNPRWLKDGEHYLLSSRGGRGGGVAGAVGRNGGQLMRVDARTGESAPFIDAAKMQAALGALPGMSADDARRLSNMGSYQLNAAETEALLNHAKDLFVYDLTTNKASRLTNGPEEEENEHFSPDGRMVSFVRANNLYVVDVSTQKERQLTTDGSQKIINGRLDWVYQEELYGRGNFDGSWWSPDSTKIAFLRLDETPVPGFVVVDHIPSGQVVEDTPYPKAGDPNPIVKLGIVDAAGGDARWVDASEKYKPEDLLIVRVNWTPDGKRVAYEAQNREQTMLDLNVAGAQDGKSATILKETSKTWVEVIDPPFWLKDGTFVWQSERTGWRHLYHYAADGRLIKQITDGKWEVRSLEGIDERNGLAYFVATEHSHIAPHVYRVRLDGTNFKRLTETEGTHRAVFNPTFSMFVDSWSDISTPMQTRLFDSDGKLVRVIDENKRDAVINQYKLGKVELLKVPTRDGFEMEAMLIRPPDFDPAKKYPVMEFTYSGPHAPQVHNSWGGSTQMWYQMLAEKGYVIWVCDNRSASGKGAEASWQVYKNFGELELRDLEDGLTWLRSQPYIDGTRVGLWGWSFGGFMTSYALTHSKSYKLGIAGGTVADWHDYDSIYTERYMLTPQDNPQGYERTAPLKAAKDLSGKLLLIHGAMDDNVHLQNTMQFVYELQKAGKQFQLMLYPKSRHGVTDPLLVKQMRQMMTDFIQQNL
ncbi:MAG: dipeptidyl-peptidase 4 [Acidobacteriota bacterium]|nr:dipeptidyl-peptidase 4 [Acidobacteriota bacterium]